MAEGRRTVRAGPLLVLQAALAELLVPVLMRLPAGRLEAVLAPLGDPEPATRADQVLDAVERAFRFHPVGRTCLTRGVALCYLLRRSGFDVALAFGIGPDSGEWRGHCWLVRDGEPYLEKVDPQEHFSEMLTVPGKR